VHVNKALVVRSASTGTDFFTYGNPAYLAFGDNRVIIRVNLVVRYGKPTSLMLYHFEVAYGIFSFAYALGA
jgi:hypothetical protein